MSTASPRCLSPLPTLTYSLALTATLVVFTEKLPMSVLPFIITTPVLVSKDSSLVGGTQSGGLFVSCASTGRMKAVHTLHAKRTKLDFFISVFLSYHTLHPTALRLTHLPNKRLTTCFGLYSSKKRPAIDPQISHGSTQIWPHLGLSNSIS